jgi:F420 biosynthesis protein FbiB-like protein
MEAPRLLPADFQRLVQTRRSIRRYTAQPVPPELVERLLTAAVWAPSAHNRQPWRFATLSRPEAKSRLAQAMGAQLRADRLADGDPLEAVEADASKSQARIEGAPVVVAVCLTLADMDRYPDARRAQAEYLMAVQSVAMAVQNLLLAAHAEGLGACWMCAPLFCGEAVRAALDLPADWQPQALVTLGWPASQGKPASRRPAAERSVAR